MDHLYITSLRFENLYEFTDSIELKYSRLE